MKNAALLFFTLCIMIVSSCKKETTNNPNASLIGKWKLDANYIGTGGPVLWITIPKDDEHVVQFNTDGTLRGNMFPTYNSYTVKDSLLTFKQATDGVQKYIHSIKRDTLTLIPNGPPYCIEGCAIRFIKEK